MAEVVDILQFVVQYGIAGIALYMLYRIAYDKLARIEDKLTSIEARLGELNRTLEQLREDIRSTVKTRHRSSTTQK